MACQICLEDFDDLLLDDPAIVRVQQLCGATSNCSADVCSRCLGQHIQTTLDGCIRGILPRVRCPICLTGINKAQWITFFPRESSGLVGHYEQLAASAFTVMPPCCHEAEYTHLPPCNTTVSHVDFSSVTGWADPPKALQTLMDDFMSHRVDASRVLAFLASAKYDNDNVLYSLLAQIYDDERRGSLYLSYLNRYPSTSTWCCGKNFCFNCKGTQCAAVCLINDGFDESTCMVRCRQCRVMLVVTDGCDSVDCLCGLEMSWVNELNYRDLEAKDLIGVDLLDLPLMVTWEAKRTMLACHLSTHYTERRLKLVTQLTNKHRFTLRRCLRLWRRYHQQLSTMKATTPSTANDNPVGSAAASVQLVEIIA